MSNTMTIDLPAFLPKESPQHPRHIEIVSTRSQKRARPKIVYALVAVVGLFLILMAQLLLSIWLSDGAYQISALQKTQVNLARDQQTVSESLNILQSPQNLAARATALGMITNSGDQGFLRLSDGAVLKKPTPAVASDTPPNLAVTTANSLITPEMAALGAGAADATGNAAGTAAGTTAAGSTAAGNTTTPGAPAGTTTGESVPSTTVPPAAAALPSPITH